ncbi:trigger factor [Holospora obtusa]|uniref:trigger factor n=1 Tax=Holospora obtusa TaxID=49893 RepID=UPI00094AA89D|nr:trigger factor [Holospora obtusa]
MRFGGSSPFIRTNLINLRVHWHAKKKVQETHSIVLDGQSIQTVLNEEVQKLALKQKIPGFRLGMAPENMIFGMYEEKITSSVLDKVLAKKLKDVPACQEALKYFVRFETPVRIRYGDISDLSVEVTFAYASEFSEIQWEDVVLPVLDDEVKEEDVRAFAERYIKQFNRFESLDVSRPSELGDTLRLRIGIKNQEGERVSVINVPLLEDSFPEEVGIKDFVGVESGHSMTQRLRVPKNFSKMQVPFAGKKVEFSLLVEEVMRTIPCTLDEASVQHAVGCDLNTLLSRAKLLLKKVIQALSYEIQQTFLENKIFNLSDIELSDILLKQKVSELKEEYQESEDFKLLVSSEVREDWFQEIARSVLLMKMFIRDYALKHTDTCAHTSGDILNVLNQLSKSKSGVGSSEELVRRYFSDKDFHDFVNDFIYEKKVMQDIIRRCGRQNPEHVLSSPWKDSSFSQKIFSKLRKTFFEDISVSDYIQNLSLEGVNLRLEQENSFEDDRFVQEASKDSEEENLSVQEASKDSEEKNLSVQEASKDSEEENLSVQEASKDSEEENLSVQEASKDSEEENLSVQEAFKEKDINKNISLNQNSE